MIVGFTITDFKGHQKEAVEYIKRVCILEDPSVAENIVKAGPGVNIFSKAIIPSELRDQPFAAIPIETQGGKSLIVSAVNFSLELSYGGKVLRLAPTEYIHIEPSRVSHFAEYIKQGLVILIAADGSMNQEWILSAGIWNDDGIWVDSDYWRDLNEQ